MKNLLKKVDEFVYNHLQIILILLLIIIFVLGIIGVVNHGNI
jgi:hypothetical protein